MKLLSCIVLLAACSQHPRSLFESDPSVDVDEGRIDRRTELAAGPLFDVGGTGDKPVGLKVHSDVLDDPQLDLKLGSDRFTVRRVGNPENLLHGAFRWTGHVDGGGLAVFVRLHDRVTGTIEINGKLYEVVPFKDTHVLRLRTWNLPPQHPKNHSYDTASNPDLKPSNGVTKIRLLVAYTSTVSLRVADIEAIVQVAIGRMNDVNRAGGVKIEFVLAEIFKTSDTENPVFEKNLAELRAPHDDRYDDIYKHQSSARASLSLLIMDSNDTFVGLASAVLATPSTAFAVLDYRYVQSYHSMAHEIGHLMGLRHEPSDDAEIKPFPEGHGFRDDARKIQTIMATTCPPTTGCPRTGAWSDPARNMGTPAADGQPTSNSARVLDKTRAYISLLSMF